MKIALVILAVFSIGLSGFSGLMLARAETPGQVALWAILLLVNIFNCINAGSALGKMH